MPGIVSGSGVEKSKAKAPGRLQPRTEMFLDALSRRLGIPKAAVVDLCVEEKTFRTFGDGPPPGWVATHRPKG